MRWPQPTRPDHEKFCAVEGWTPVRNAYGHTGTVHVTLELRLPDGRILRTRISQPPDRTAYGPSIWGHVLCDQLDVSEAEFWSCVRDGVPPSRGLPEPPPEALPADVVYLLVTRVGLAEPEVAKLTTTEAIDRLREFWNHGG